MAFLIATVSLSLLFIMYSILESTLVKVERLDLSKGKDKIKIAHISDIHIKKLNVSFKKIKKILDKECPDIVLLSGDYIEKSKDSDKFFTFIKILPKNKVYACLGNHDYTAYKDNPKELKQFIKSLQMLKVDVLNNASRCIDINGRQINIVGIPDIKYKKHNIASAFININPEADCTVTFSHNPDIVFQLQEKPMDILLCGHFHGGQIWAPFHFEFKLLRKEKLCKMGIYKGLHTVNGIKLYINRGLGNVLIPLRFMSKPEILILKI